MMPSEEQEAKKHSSSAARANRDDYDEYVAEHSSWAADRDDYVACITCSNGHLQSSNSDNPCDIPNANLCPCCHQALGAFRSWIDGDERQALRNAILAKDPFLHGKLEKFKHPHHSDLQNVLEAIESYGCRLCALLMGPYFPGSYQHTVDLRPIFGPLFLYFEASILDKDSYCHLAFFVGIGNGQGMNRSSMISLLPLGELGAYTQLNACSNLRKVANSIAFDKYDLERATAKTSSDYTSSLSQAKAWLKECLHSHAHCDIDTGSRLLNPTRLISIHGAHIHLCSGHNLPPRTPYVTLSHCWGGLEILTLTKSSLVEFQSRINLNDLCKSFQDAVHIARELGYGYVWIDSLCIIQDSEADWNQESTAMTQVGLESPYTICANVFQVYGNSSLNIAATGASDGRTGCFFERAPASQQKFDIGLFLEGKLQGFRFFDNLISQYDLVDQPLYKRAWTLQERILPVRTLHFSEWELFWECKTKSVCESFPDDRPSPGRAGHFEKQGSLPWEKVVMLYSGGKLTKSKDKLVAISGVAQSYGASEDYLAGMWRPGLEFMLRWSKPGIPESTRRLYGIPSWSWASMNDRVEFFNDLKGNRRFFAMVRSAWTNCIDGKSFGEVRGGVLQLECELLLPIRPMQHTNPDGLFDRLNRPIPKSKLCSWIHEFKWDHYDDRDEANFNNSIYLVPIFEHTAFQNHVLDVMEGLMLRSTDGKRGEYRRIGWFCIDRFTSPPAWVWLKAAILESKLPSNKLMEKEYISLCTDKGGESRVLIEII